MAGAEVEPAAIGRRGFRSYGGAVLFPHAAAAGEPRLEKIAGADAAGVCRVIAGGKLRRTGDATDGDLPVLAFWRPPRRCGSRFGIAEPAGNGATKLKPR